MQGHRTVRAGPTAWEHAPVTTYAEPRVSPGSLFLLTVARPAWAYRVELAGVTALAVAYYWLSARFSGRTAEAVILASAVVVAAVPATREGLAGLLHRAHLRRRWELACRHAELANRNDHTPRITRAGLVPSGELLRVRMPAGAAVADLEKAAEPVAAFLEARELRVAREAGNARYARVVVVRRDPLAELPGLAWPNLGASGLSVWEPIPVGINDDGQLVTVGLVERNVLIGGEPGGGKSVALSLLVATAALDPDVILVTLDGKYVELAPWVGCAARTVGLSQDECIDVLKALVTEMDSRYLTLVANRQRKIHRADGWTLHVVVCDELAFYLNTTDRTANREAGNLFRDLVSRGRAAGFVVLAATQKPSGDTIPTYLRDLFAFRWAFRCTTPQMSDTILGGGWASVGFNAGTVDAAHRGIGFLLHEGGQPVRLRTFYLADDDLDALARRAERLRAAHQATAKLPPPSERPQSESGGAA